MSRHEELIDRRSAIGGLARDLARGAMGLFGPPPAPSPSQRVEEASPEPDPRTDRRLPAAILPHTPFGIADALRVAEECGLGHREKAIRALSRPSACFALASAAASTGETAVSRLGGPSGHLAAIELSEVAGADALGLPADGVLTLSLDLDLISALPSQVGAPVTATLEERQPAEVAPPGYPVATAFELTLPRVWSDHVAPIGLSASEQGAWERMRIQLAAEQGAGAFDEVPRAIHRLLGWPDQRAGWMPLAAAMRSAGIDLDETPAFSHPRAREFEDQARRWQLLLEVSADPELGIGWGPDRERLYVWIDEQDLAAQDFSRSWGFVL